jgi:hypothetical protein
MVFIIIYKKKQHGGFFSKITFFCFLKNLKINSF